MLASIPSGREGRTGTAGAGCDALPKVAPAAASPSSSEAQDRRETSAVAEQERMCSTTSTV
eukprot:CAMPEP_0181222510 /NCGR_PEP_ID=MMETSP1096-20121128/30005_1 /TAXON_ID=156174 ORGANISM="Chrysochromulina ericina, Strain CCMP281" /NCGR_SAMPLE_ID=MMETSP1096 /ASSEMBLY_ACC=CAM_ASM_000453 /LENGTH=60 /DNA_ID=CAMNT_0023315277 /DNA_START=226 /DNA_END=407 /DNA_ORIENTATION=-